jgi:hypothetical protein
MCDCESKNIVDLHQIKIYLDMATYEVKKEWLGKGLCSALMVDMKGKRYKADWDNSTQEQLAYVYEELRDGPLFINKTNKASEKAEKSEKKAKKPNENNDKEE